MQAYTFAKLQVVKNYEILKNRSNKLLAHMLNKFSDMRRVGFGECAFYFYLCFHKHSQSNISLENFQ